MNTLEFENYLKSIGGLISGYRTDLSPITSNICECSEGWLELIKNLIQELIDIGWNKEIVQIKEKFGGLRFYTGELSQEGQKIITKYENLSYKTCEECGKKGTRRDGSWIRTLCDKHAKENDVYCHFKSLIRRLKKIGIELDMFSNAPWIYIDTINGKKVTEKLGSDHKFTIGFHPAKKGDEFQFIDLKEVFKIIRKYR